MSSEPTPPFDGPQLGDTVDGLTLIAVGIRDTFTEVLPAHREAFTLLNEWMSGIRLYELEDALDLDANFWDELLDCDYEVGEGEIDEAPMLYIGEEVGTGQGPAVDIALDPLEGTTLTAKDMPNALTVIAMAQRGTLLHAPDVYMDKLAVGPGYPKDVVSLDMTPT